MTLIVNGLWRLCSIYRASLAATLGRIAVSAIFTWRFWPPAQRRPVKHTETEKAPRVEARDPASSKTIKAEPANVLALPKTNKADQQVAFSCFQDAVAEAIAEGAHQNQKAGGKRFEVLRSGRNLTPVFAKKSTLSKITFPSHRTLSPLCQC